MSASAPIATVSHQNVIGREGPGADLSRCSKQSVQKPGLLDHLVGAAKQRNRKGDTERPSGLQVDDQLDFGRLLDW
jgi:hypothetical protein